MWGRRSMLKLLGLAAVGATAGVVTGRVIDVADSDASSDGPASRAAGGSPSAAAPAPAPPRPRARPTIVASGSPMTMRMTYRDEPETLGAILRASETSAAELGLDHFASWVDAPAELEQYAQRSLHITSLRRVPRDRRWNLLLPLLG